MPGWALWALGWGSELGGQKGWLAPPACSRDGLLARNQGNHQPSVSIPEAWGGLSGRDPAGRQRLGFLLPIPLVPVSCQLWTRLSETLEGLSLPLSSPADWDSGVSPPAHLHLSPRLARMACLVLATRFSVRHVLRQMFVSLCPTSINSELPWLLEKHQLSQCGHAAGPLWVGSSKAQVYV